jgi:hypothetical protein
MEGLLSPGANPQVRRVLQHSANIEYHGANGHAPSPAFRPGDPARGEADFLPENQA